MVEIFQLLHSKFFVILQSLGSPLHDLPEKHCLSCQILPKSSSSSYEPDKTIDLPERIPSSGIGPAYQFQKEQYQHFAFPILFCPIQPALQIILSEPQTLLDQLSFQGIPEVFFLFGQNSDLCHKSKLHILLTVDNGLSRLANGSQRLARISPRLNVPRTRNTEWVSTYFTLLRKQWWN